MVPGSVTGVVGLIKWAYYVAAAINGYTVVRSPAGTWSLTATVVQSDAFKLSQRPLLFVAPHARGEWQWPILSYTLENGRLTAKLGVPDAIPQERHGLAIRSS